MDQDDIHNSWDTGRDHEREPDRSYRSAPQLNTSGTLRAMVECSHESHEALKADAHRWDALPIVGSQVYQPDRNLGDEWSAYRLVLKNCTHCHSTLATEEAL